MHNFGPRCLAAACVLLFSAPAVADFDDPPKPRIDCTKKKNKNNPACSSGHAQATREEAFNAAYWLNRQGRHAEALGILTRFGSDADARMLNERGFAARKQGDIERALADYRRALTLDPDYVLARAYMGEALLAQGDVAAARHELDEIARRCGKDCTAWVSLKSRIARFEGTQTGG